VKQGIKRAVRNVQEMGLDEFIFGNPAQVGGGAAGLLMLMRSHASTLRTSCTNHVYHSYSMWCMLTQTTVKLTSRISVK
jgi:hypothetical protein